MLQLLCLCVSLTCDGCSRYSRVARAAPAAATLNMALGGAATATTTTSLHQHQPAAHSLLVVMLGLPAAGKSTAAAFLAATAAQHQVAAHHVCLDELLLAHSTQQQAGDGDSSFSTDAWQACRRQLVQLVEALLSKRQQSPQQPERRQLVLVDDNHHYHSMRYEFLQLARRHGAAFLQLHLQCPLELALQRNSARAAGAGRVPETVMRHCAAAFEPPDAAKRPWEAGVTLTLQQAELPPLAAAAAQSGQLADGAAAPQTAGSRLWSLLLDRWGAAVPPLPSAEEAAAARAAASAANLASRVHQADLASRAMLHDTLSGMHKDARAEAGRVLNVRRKHLLQALKRHQQQPQADTLAPAAASGVEVLLQGFQHALQASSAAAAAAEAWGADGALPSGL